MKYIIDQRKVRHWIQYHSKISWRKSHLKLSKLENKGDSNATIIKKDKKYLNSDLKATGLVSDGLKKRDSGKVVIKMKKDTKIKQKQSQKKEKTTKKNVLDIDKVENIVIEPVVDQMNINETTSNNHTPITFPAEITSPDPKDSNPITINKIAEIKNSEEISMTNPVPLQNQKLSKLPNESSGKY